MRIFPLSTGAGTGTVVGASVGLLVVVADSPFVLVAFEVAAVELPAVVLEASVLSGAAVEMPVDGAVLSAAVSVETGTDDAPPPAHPHVPSTAAANAAIMHRDTQLKLPLLPSSLQMFDL